MKLLSPAFEFNELIPSKYTCQGENISPPLEIVDVPKEVQSLVLIVDDPDAVSGVWDHWLVVNIDPSTTSVAEGEVPTGGEQITNSFGKPDYGGPCPPDEPVHHYRFKLYALDAKLNAAALNSKADIESAMRGHFIAQAELIGLYQK